VLLALFQQISQASAAIDRIVTVLSFSKKKRIAVCAVDLYLHKRCLQNSFIDKAKCDEKKNCFLLPSVD
jgi:hypothetical protein